jgi:thiol-disulfide isomerase/thioredoxin
MSERYERLSHWFSARPWGLLALTVAVVLSGCGQRPQSGGEKGDLPLRAGAASDKSAPVAEAGEAVELKPVDRAQFDAELAGLRGKVVLVDFWATWCAPCLEQLPHTTALADERRGDGLAVVTMGMDDPDDAARLARMLATRGAAATTNFVSSYGGGSKGMEAFEIEGGALPQYRLYDRSGKLRRTFALDPAAKVQFTSDDVAAAVAELLAE